MKRVREKGEIRELTNLLKTQNKYQEILEHICEISNLHIWLFTDKTDK